MKRIRDMFSMVQAITVLTVLKMLADAQTTCNGGAGRVVYERLPDQQLQGFDDDIIKDSAPPFRVLERCQELCLRDRTSTNNLVHTCSSFDFQPGSRLDTYSAAADYEESTCYLSAETAQPEGIGNLMMVPNSVHFTEVCLTLISWNGVITLGVYPFQECDLLAASRIERECPNRRYVFERHSRKKLKLPQTDVKEVSATNRTECEDKCLNEFSFVCRSATFDASMRSCIMSRFTRRTHPELLEDSANSEYLENTCLNAEHRCDGLAVFIKEENKRLRGPFEVDVYTNLTLDECQALCLRAEKYFCRSVEFVEPTRQCVISEEDSVSQRDDIGISNPGHHFYDLVCLDNHPSIARGSEYPDNSATSHLFSDSRRPDTAFQRFRNSRLSGEFHSEITGRSLSECLDECLRQPSFQCRSAVYSEQYRTCRLSKFNQRDGHRIIYDADYDYYENLMHQHADDGGPAYRPDPLGQDTHGRPLLGRPGYSDDGYPSGNSLPSRPAASRPLPTVPNQSYPNTGIPPHYLPGDIRNSISYNPPDDPRGYNSYPNRYPMEYQYPSIVGEQIPYPGDDRYRPPYASGGFRHPSRPSVSSALPPLRPTGSRFPGVIHRYPSVNSLDRPGAAGAYPQSSIPNRFPYVGGGDGYPVDQYPAFGIDGNKLPPERYPVNGDRLSDKDYPYYGSPRHPTYGGNKDYDRPYGGAPYAPSGRPPVSSGYGSGGPGPGPPPGNSLTGPSSGYDDGAIVGGGYIGEGGVYHSRPLGSTSGSGSGGPIIGRPPLISRCDEGDSFRQVSQGTRVRQPFVRRVATVSSERACGAECSNARDFVCRSFNYRGKYVPAAGPGIPGSPLAGSQPQYGPGGAGVSPEDRDNCELSDRDSKDMDIGNPIYYDSASDYDFYERNSGRQGIDDCLDVSQICSEEGMEFTLRTPEAFIGRIYTHNHYDKCFFRGSGGTVNVLRISGSHGYPECGTQRYGDTMTNIVVVQFSDYVQTDRDKRFNLTCMFRGPDETVVTSGYIDAGRSAAPVPIEYLPAENTLSSKVRLMILYQGRPTTTIAVGDPLTFRLEAIDGYTYSSDIFATNVVAKDPYSGRSVQLIDRYGCPVDNYVFPGLDRLREGDSLEARFNAFKIPESNFLVFEAHVRTCREGCQPAFCPSHNGRSEPSFGRKRRSIDPDDEAAEESDLQQLGNSTSNNDTTISRTTTNADELVSTGTRAEVKSAFDGPDEFVRSMIEVFDSRFDMDEENSTTAEMRIAPVIQTVCMSPDEYYGLVGASIALLILLTSIIAMVGFIYRKYVYTTVIKNRKANRLSTRNSSRITSSCGTSSKMRFGGRRSSHNTMAASISAAIAGNFSFLSAGHSKPNTLTSPMARTLSSVVNQQAADRDDLPPRAAQRHLGIATGLSTSSGSSFDPSEPIYSDASLFEIASSQCSLIVPSDDKNHTDNNFRLA
ncbi:hypothetical protein QAD02_005868 [Eretmocerus hayati]|uniref:Uncharacterized protein n=1 Tax=Eretmocerus hayati TaxID=131215 RepID=A0ACC2NVH3_9HYME|nr:hypothetical protein QAD02_005868 [Eretmocerus hayati]